MATSPSSASKPVNPGAKWWKVDFHAHSPASFDFGAEEGKRAAAPTSYRDWLLAYMKNGVDGVVITDHNTHEGIDKARTELAVMREEEVEDYRDLVLFSGVEFTVDGGYHLLGVFDVDTPSDDINGLLHVCGYSAERGSSLGTTRMSFAQVVEEIIKKDGLAVPAHADVTKGLFGHDLRNQDDLEQSKHIVAVEVMTEEGARKAANRGWVKVLGSDAHHLDDAACPEGVEPKYPGSHFTWVKMEEPNLFGIKLALSDGDQSVVPAKIGDPDPNDYSHTVIECVVVEKGSARACYRFGPWMNTVIGGRGVGKSTIIELVRLAMGRFSDLPMELQSDGEYFSPLPGRKATSRFWDQDTRVEVHLARLGRQYRVLWQGKEPDNPTIEVLHEGEWKSEGGMPRDRFALLINSQKQIYETARDAQSLLKAIDDQPSIGYVTWKETFDELCGQYRTQRSEINELKIKIASEDRLKGELSDVLVELEHVSKLRDSPETHELDRLMQEEQETARSESIAVRLEHTVAAMVEEYSDLQSEDKVDGEGSAKSDVWEEEQTRRSDIQKAYAALVAAAKLLHNSRKTWETVAVKSPRRQRIEELNLLLNPVNEDADEADAGAGHLLDPNEANTRLLQAKSEREAALAAIGKAKTKLERLKGEASETLETITKHRADLTARRIALADALSGDDLKLQVLAQADDSMLETDLRRLVQKSTSFDLLFGENGLPLVLDHPYKPKRDSRVLELKKILKELRAHGVDAPLLKNHSTVVVDQRFFAHLKSIDEHAYQTEVDLWFPEDRLRVRYRQDGTGGLREIDQGSPGEKTAALLAVVLQLSNDPLLLDQPEDDLDNKLIYDLVVTTLKRIKTGRLSATVEN
ncbi:PHP domain-containing protein [Pseudarthrobacter phenanthrenivorans Sphe3]|uniref:PHP domain-containing protein n=1 Tax=Pseudarthrobacter phenanthrenivorans (strain DSM 18606 / JCM 16027 / LMG 23796 / Sphe3) TaxID=930171 RepID=F0M4M6_PSEPM|nr:PHP domain-containing protein [Pseudarthrobacter phenanthrenivorans]ADX74573.1 PHP domain-containing protein [Pseudarthrobacter phenanthrenivorans Sphe3]